jgi:hypothetical protein
MIGNALQLRTVPQEFPEPVGGFPEMYSLRNKELTDVVVILAVLGGSGTRS